MGLAQTGGLSGFGGLSSRGSLASSSGLTSNNSALYTQFDLTTATPTVPTGWTYTRGDNLLSTRRDNTGIMRLMASNTAPFDYDVNGVGLGLKIEVTRTNVCTNQNMVPTDTTGVTKGGDIASVLSCIDDTANLTTAKLHLVGNAKVLELDNTLGITAATATISGQTGSTSACSMSAYVYCVSGSGSLGLDDAVGIVNFSANATYTLTKSENFTPAATTKQMMITAAAGAKVRFILNQLEVGVHASTVIKVAGASATRGSPTFGDLSILTRSYFNFPQGAIIVDFDFDDITNASLGRLVGLTDGTNGIVNCMNLYKLAATTRRKVIPQFDIASSNMYTPDVGSYDAKNQRWSCAMTWVDGQQANVATGGGWFVNFPISSGGLFAASGINRIYFGCRASVEQINGHVKKITFYKSFRTPQQLGKDMVNTGDRGVLFCGQSNATNLFSSQSGSNNSGEIALKAVTDAIWATSRNFFINSATAGTTAKRYAGSVDSDYWLDTATGEMGLPFRRWKTMARGCSNATYKAIVDVAGESDAGQCTVQEFVDVQIAKFNIMRALVGSIPVIQVPIGRNTGGAAYQTIREAQWLLAGAQNPGYIYNAPERFDLALADGLHITDGATGTTLLGDRIARKMHKVLGDVVSGGVDGPTITNATRIATAVTVTIAQDNGTDFTPTSSISGFHYYNGPDDGSTENVITAAVRTNATTITLTLTSSSAGTLYYGHGALNTDTAANLVKDNSAQALPLRSNKLTVT